MNTLALLLLRCMIQVTLLAAATGSLYWLARRISPRAAATSLLSGLLLVLGLSLLSASPWPRWQFSAPDAVGAPSQLAAASATEGPGAPAANRNADPSAATSNKNHASPPTPTLGDYAEAFWDALTVAPAFDAPSARPWVGWLAAAAMLGMLAAAVRLCWALFNVRRLVARSSLIEAPSLLPELDRVRRQLHVHQAVELRQSPTLETPATVGWRRPAVLLPRTWRDWSDDELRAALAHEMAHVAGRDFLGWVMARVAVAVHFYNPLVRWLAARLQLEQELAADAAAAAAIGESDRYLRSLASLALSTPPHRLSGPARTLIPSRSLLMRRVEMLRSPMRTLKSQLVADRLQWVVGGCLMLLAVAIAGLRPPASALAQQDARQGVQQGEVQFEASQEINAEQSPDRVERISLTLVPPQADLVIAVRPAEIFADEVFRPLVAQMNAAAPPFEAGDVGVQDVAEVLVAASFGQSQPRIVLRLVSSNAADQMLAYLTTDLKKIDESRPTWQDEPIRITRLDASTVVIQQRGSDKAEDSWPLLGEQPNWAGQWRQRDDQQVVFALDNAKLRASLFPPDRENTLAGGMPLQMVAPLLEHVDAVYGGLRLDGQLQLRAVAATDGSDSAQRVADTLQALMTLGRNMLANQQRALADAPPEARPSIEQLLKMSESFLTNAQVAVQGDQVQLSFDGTQEMGGIAVGTALVLPAVQSAREAARRTQSMNNLKQLSVAMHVFADKHGHFPAASNYEYVDPATGQTKRSEHPHSWRVALLPHLEQQALYDAYQFDQPWDSDANRRLAETAMPLYHDPSDAGASTSASYFVLTGPATAFPNEQGVKLRDITDGASNTLLIVEAKRDIPWTKPEDIGYQEGAALPQLGGNHPGLFLAAFADGSVHVVAMSIDQQVLRGLITRSGGEAVSIHDYDQPGPPRR